MPLNHHKDKRYNQTQIELYGSERKLLEEQTVCENENLLYTQRNGGELKPEGFIKMGQTVMTHSRGELNLPWLLDKTRKDIMNKQIILHLHKQIVI